MFLLNVCSPCNVNVVHDADAWNVDHGLPVHSLEQKISENDKHFYPVKSPSGLGLIMGVLNSVGWWPWIGKMVILEMVSESTLLGSRPLLMVMHTVTKR